MSQKDSSGSSALRPVEQAKDQDSELPYIVEITVRRGTVIGGGLPNNAYAEVYLDGKLQLTTKTVPSQPEWNEHVSIYLADLEPPSPVLVGFSLYKKRWTSSGFKLVGSMNFPLTDHLEDLNKGPVQKELHLHSNRRNLTLYGTLFITIEIKKSEDGSPCEDTTADPKRERGYFIRRAISFLSMGYLTPETSLDTLDSMAGYYHDSVDFENEELGHAVMLSLVIIFVIAILRNYFELESFGNWTNASLDKVANLHSTFEAVTSRLQATTQAAVTT